MTHTTNYNLNKFEATDRVTRDGFNDNADAIDAALKSVSDAASTAQSTAATALAAAQAAAAAGCRVVAGTYTGTGTYGSSNPNTLTFDRAPIAVFIGGGTTLCLLNGAASASSVTSANSQIKSVGLSWSGNSVSWWSTTSQYYQANVDGATYGFLALLAAN